MRFIKLSSALLLFQLIVCGVCFGQNSTQNYIYDTGAPQYGVNIPVENGFINVTNGNLHLEFSLAGHPQRGSLKLNERLVYDSRIWEIGHYSNYYWWPDNVPRDSHLALGWRFVAGNEVGSVEVGDTPSQFQCGSVDRYGEAYQYNHQYFYDWLDPSGVRHPFSGVFNTSYSDCNPTDPAPETSFGQATDSSGYRIKMVGDDQNGPTSVTITDADGNTVYPEVVDRYGNTFSTPGNGDLVDDRGQIPVITTYDSDNRHIYYDVLREGGTRVRYTVTTISVSPQTAFNEQAVCDYPCGNVQILNAVQSIQLPDNSLYQFEYNDDYGMLTKVTLPTGGVVTYGWSNFFDSYSNQNRWLTSRAVGSDPPSTFTPSVVSTCSASGTGCQEKMTVHEPGGDETVYSLTLNNGAWNTATSRYAGSSTASANLVSSTTTAYDYSQPCGSYCVGSQFITAQSMTTTLADSGWMRTDSYEYSDSSLGLIKSHKIYDFYKTSLPAQPLAETRYTYPGNALSPGDIGEIDQLDGAGDLISKRLYDYTTSAPPSGLSGHVAIPGATYLQSVTDWVNTDGSSVTTQYSIDDAGTLHSTTKVAGGISYPATVYSSDAATDTFVTATTYPAINGVSLSNSTSPDQSTGLPESSSDFNSKQTLYRNYDWAGRVGEIDSPAGGKVVYTYNDPIEKFTYTTLNSRGEVGVEVDQVDEFGRPSRTALNNGQPSNQWYQQDTCYNTDGRVEYVSTPYAGTGYGMPKACSGTHYTYDTLGRPWTVTNADGTVQYAYRGRASSVTDVNGVQKITQIDALGRTTAVCEVVGSAGSAGAGAGSDCQLDLPGTGFLTTYAYNDVAHTVTVHQGALLPRTFVTDSLGRAVSTTEPESGTTTYTYSYTADGAKTIRSRPAVNYAAGSNAPPTATSSQYDLLGRLSSITYSDGTPQKTYIYDSPDPNEGLPFGAVKGRLVAAHSGYSSAVWAGTWFGYDDAGHPSISLQCFPGRCGNPGFDVVRTYAYDFAGRKTDDKFLVQGYTGAVADTNIQYSIAGEVTAISNNLTGPANANGSVYATLQNTPLGPQQYQFGDGLQGYRAYDQVGRNWGKYLCQGTAAYQCQGSTQIYSEQAGFSGNRLTVYDDTFMTHLSTTYDSLNRLASFSYSGGIGASFTYDRYGNRWSQTATQGSVPQPSVSFDGIHNHINGYSYDGAGNLLNDGVHGFQYDAENNVINGDGVTYFYDAFNHRVRIDTSNTRQDIAFDADGNCVSVWDGLATHASIQSAETYLGKNVISYWLNGGGPTLGNYPTGWIYCASENQTCSIPHGATSAFGANGSYTMLDQPSGGDITCTRDTFGGDPVPNVLKACYYSPSASEIGGTTHFQHEDLLGTIRFRTSALGVVEATYSSLPFGDAFTRAGSDDDKNHFAFLDRDNETDSQHALFREYDSRLGNWLSPDPYSGSYDFSNPQSMNRYSYVLNSPLSMTDSTGEDGCLSSGVVDVAGGPATIFVGCAGSVIGSTLCGPLCGIVIGDVLGGLADLAELLFVKPQFKGSLHPRPSTPQSPDHTCSVSAKSLDSYLGTKNSPMVGEGADLMAAGEKYNLDPRLLVSLSGAETTFGTHITAGQFNAFNVLYHGLNSPFASFQSAINSVGHSITNPRNAYDLTNTKTLYQHYCFGSNCSTGLKNVDSFMDQQGADKDALHYPCGKED